MKNNDHELNKPVPEKGYKKKYLQRLLEEADTKKYLEKWRKNGKAPINEQL